MHPKENNFTYIDGVDLHNGKKYGNNGKTN